MSIEYILLKIFFVVVLSLREKFMKKLTNASLCIYDVHTKTYWPAGGGQGQYPENTAQGHSGQNAIRP